jgi:hypothetical protein
MSLCVRLFFLLFFLSTCLSGNSFQLVSLPPPSPTPYSLISQHQVDFLERTNKRLAETQAENGELSQRVSVLSLLHGRVSFILFFFFLFLIRAIFSLPLLCLVRGQGKGTSESRGRAIEGLADKRGSASHGAAECKLQTNCIHSFFI